MFMLASFGHDSTTGAALSWREAAGGERRIKKKPESFRKRLRQKQRKRGRLTRPLTVLLVDLGGHEGNDHDDAQETAANGENSAIETHTILLALGRDFPKLVLKRLIRPVHTGKNKKLPLGPPRTFLQNSRASSK